MEASGFCWCALQSCAGIVSACLPTMVLVVRQKPSESHTIRIRTRLFNSWPWSKLSENSKYLSNAGLLAKSSTPNKRDDLQLSSLHVIKSLTIRNQYNTYVEATQMPSFKGPRKDRILMVLSITNDLSLVWRSSLARWLMFLNYWQGVRGLRSALAYSYAAIFSGHVVQVLRYETGAGGTSLAKKRLNLLFAIWISSDERISKDLRWAIAWLPSVYLNGACELLISDRGERAQASKVSNARLLISSTA